MTHSRYFFTKDYNLEALPDFLKIVQPGVRYSTKERQELLRYAPQEHKLPKQNFFQKLKYWYDNGNVPKSQLSGFGELGAEKMYVDLYQTKPWQHIVGNPKLENIISDRDVVKRRERIQEGKECADRFAHRPYRYRALPWPRTISHDVNSLDEPDIIKHARRYDRRHDLSKSLHLPQSVNKRYTPVTDQFKLRLPLLKYGWRNEY